MTLQRRVFASGVVQGVGFRQSTEEEAQRYPSLRGFVRNLPDGRVEALFIGPEDPVLALVAWCKTGPSSARVSRLEVIEEPVDPGQPPFRQER